VEHALSEHPVALTPITIRVANEVCLFAMVDRLPTNELQRSDSVKSQRKRLLGLMIRRDTLDASTMNEASSIKDIEDYINKLIHAHSGRVEQYKLWLKCNASEVERDIRRVMDDIWETIPWRVERYSNCCNTHGFTDSPISGHDEVVIYI
jgi:hypothetical protein